MPEILLHYIWQKRIWSGFPQLTTDGKPIEVISVGQYNIHAGPDFSHAHIRIDGQDWVGNIEIHVHASDWYKHRHHTDAAYNTTILHVVAKADKVAEECYVQKLTERAKKHRKPNSELMATLTWIVKIVSLIIIPIAIGIDLVNYKNPIISETFDNIQKFAILLKFV